MSKVALITGSGRGIGAATALLAAQKGYAVCVNYLSNAARANEVVAKIRAGGGKAIAVEADTSRDDEVRNMFLRVDAELGPISALVNNAGITGRLGRLGDFDAATMRRILDVNVVGTMLCCQEAVKRMSTKNGGAGGCIVNLSSIAATVGGANQWIPYAAAKGAINTFTVGLSREVAAEGIRVNAVSPGLIDTEIHIESGNAARIPDVVKTIPVGRIGRPEEIAEAILWLMSGEAAYMIGGVLSVAGGR